VTVQDLPAQITLLLELGVTLLGVFVVYDGLTQFGFFANSAAFVKAGEALTVLDYAGVTIMAGFFIGSFVLASKVQASKLTLPISLAFVVISALIGAIFSNVWSGLVTGTALTSAAQSLPFMSRILLNLPLLIIVSGVLINIALYGRVGSPTTRARRAAR